MNITDVLDAKGRSIETAFAWENVEDIIARFACKNISSVVITDRARKPIGIVTDRTVVNGVATLGSDVLDLTAREIMQSPIPSCCADDSVQRAMELMTNRRVRHLLVMRDEEVAGLVSIGDLVKYRIRDAELENDVLRDLAPAWLAGRA